MSRTKSTKKPETERILTELQESYLKDRNKSDYDKMFVLMITYAKSLLLKQLRGKIYLPPEVIEDYSIEAGVKMMSEYIKPNHRIDSSFAGLLSFKILECLFSPKQKRTDKISSLNDHIENGKSARSTEVGDLSESLGFTYLWQPSHDAFSDPLYYIVDRNKDTINSVVSVYADLVSTPGIGLHTSFLVGFGLLKRIQNHKSYEPFVNMFMNEEQKRVLDIAILEMSVRLKEWS